jgi:tagaturonate epimerase
MTNEVVRSELARWLRKEQLVDASPTAVSAWKAAAVQAGSGAVAVTPGSLSVYPRSVFATGAALAILVGVEGVGEGAGIAKYLVLVSSRGFDAPAPDVAVAEGEGLFWAFVPADTTHVGVVHRLFPWTRPVSLRERRTTIGMGDRLGRATAGHIRAARQYACSPVLAQQSVRELDFTGRTFTDVIADAAWLVYQEGFEDGYGADGDHLKNIPWIDTALTEGFPMITLDLTEVMRPEVADWDAARIAEGWDALDGAFRERVERDYSDRDFLSGADAIHLTGETARLCAVMYGPALDFASEVDGFLREKRGDAYDLEISIDETTTPTLPEHHLFIARELQERRVAVNSVAPRFVGEFQKAVDYDGDIEEFSAQFRVHCRIADAFGGYKVSVHSGSDKFSVYPVVGRETGMRLHLKTSGTSWLEALRVVATVAPETYRRIHAFALEYYPEALKAYHITADLSRMDPLSQTGDAELRAYLDHPDARQMLHISYGGVLTHPELGREFRRVLDENEEAYAEQIRRHFEKHLDLLGVEKREVRS